MKKLLLTIASLFLLASCATATADKGFQDVVEPKESVTLSEEVKPVVVYGERSAAIYPRGASTHTTYLMLSRYGTIEVNGTPVAGGTVSQLYYEHTYEWKAEPGTPLPVASSTVPGATFRGWAYYDEDNDNVFPDYYENVPVKANLALKAIFDGTSAGGGGGGGGGGGDPASVISFTITQFADWVPNDAATVFVWSWGGGSGDGAWSQVTLAYQGENNEYHNVSGTFNAPSDITGFNIARCSAGTTLPNWTAVGDAAGRVYNKTANVDVRSGVTSYTAPEFVPYEYNA